MTSTTARPTGSEPAIEALDLVKTYRGDVRALNGLTVRAAEATVFGLLGPNGAGKSTTVRVLTTLTTPDGGRARVAGIDVLAEPERVRRVIGLVAQSGGLDPDATGRENLVLQGNVHGLRGGDVRRRTKELLDRFGLADAADRLVRTYSGGMKRRLDVALGLVHRPAVLFLDEPTTGLDPQSRATMWAEIARLTRDEGVTVLLTTHYLEEADRLATSLAIVDKGQVVAQGTPEALKGELRGDTVTIQLHEADVASSAAAADLLARVPGLRDVRVDGAVLSARADAGATAVPVVLSAMDAAGLRAQAVSVARPSLDDVYLRHTGRRYTEVSADSGGADEPGRTGGTAERVLEGAVR